MRAALVVGTIGLALGAAAAASPARGRRAPVLRVVAQTVRGTHFHRRELVRVTFRSSVRETHRVRADTKGSFTTPLPDSYDPCVGPLTIVAVGSRKDAARLKLPQRACLPPP
jgi:hypothetical protein